MKKFYHLLLATIILNLSSPIHSSSQDKRQTIVNGEIVTVTLDSLNVFKEDSILKNTFVTDFYGNTINKYEQRLEKKRQESWFNAFDKWERDDKRKKEQVRVALYIIMWLIFGLTLVLCFFLVIVEHNGRYPNSLGRITLSLKDKLIETLRKLKTMRVLIFTKRQCPFCKSRINVKASVCKHCLRNLTEL